MVAIQWLLNSNIVSMLVRIAIFTGPASLVGLFCESLDTSHAPEKYKKLSVVFFDDFLLLNHLHFALPKNSVTKRHVTN
jgi:uncharacterized protein YqkB